MTDSADVKALIERVKFFAPWAERVQERPEDAWRLIHDLADALEASQQAPAVDVRRLAEALHADDCADDECDGGDMSHYDRQAQVAVASGILQDADELRAEVLEDAATVVWSMSPQGPESEDARDVLLRLAQAIREGRA